MGTIAIGCLACTLLTVAAKHRRHATTKKFVLVSAGFPL